MRYKFSEGLREKLIEYFKRDYGMDITQETADEWLDSLSDLFLIFDSMRHG
ncbi:MAG: hypothetical protein Q8K92_08805 [Leadbetterella sp.]|nr:hypothetical protein [Leadbetterella sp.]